MLRTQPPLSAALDLDELRAALGDRVLQLPDRQAEDAAAPGFRELIRRLHRKDDACIDHAETESRRLRSVEYMEEAHYRIAPALGIAADEADQWLTVYDPGTDRFITYPLGD